MPITYAGVSNKIQSVPTVTETGRCEVTGEVISTSEIDSSLEGGYALRVFDMERIADASIASSFEADADRVEQRIKAQLEFDDSEGGRKATVARVLTAVVNQLRNKVATGRNRSQSQQRKWWWGWRRE